MINWLRKQFSKLHGWGDGLSFQGPWRVTYPDGNRTRGLQYGEACTMQQLHGGTLSYEPKDQP